MRLAGVLQDRNTWTTAGSCPIEKAMKVVGSRNTMLILREAFYGTTRFADFADRVGMTDATAAANLKTLVNAGLLEKRAYQDAGSRTRDEYVITDAGRELMPIVVGLFVWGMKHCDSPPPLELRHVDCAEPVHVDMVCAGGHPVESDDLELRATKRS